MERTPPRTAAPTVESRCSLLARSGLLKGPQIQAAFKQWRQIESRPAPGEVARFTQWLVANHYVTAYQARQLSVGQTNQFFLNHYKLLDLIGAGRMAGIFKAAHNLGQIVAIKLMPASKSQDPTLLLRFKREAKMAVRLKHPNIVRTYHLGSDGQRHYIVMEYLEGETLEDVLKRRRKLPHAEAVRLIHQALCGLQHIHEKEIIHRDLKPANLMLVPPRPPGAPDNTLLSSIKILDIGVGRMLFDESVKGDGESPQLTTAGTMLGNAEYVAPEQARNAHAADIRSDIYSLACVLYHCLTGRPPFTGERELDVMLKHFTETPRPVHELEPSVPAGLSALVSTMLAKDRDQRPAWPEKAAQALQPFLAVPNQVVEQASSLTRSYLQWVDSQPIEEVNGAPTAAGRWYYGRNGITIGPFPTSQLTQLATAGKLGPTDMLWMEGDDPTLAIPAKAAIDFTGSANPSSGPTTATQIPRTPVQTPTAPVRQTATPAPPAPAPRTAAQARGPTPAGSRAPATPAEMGFNPDTGQILDQVKFAKWQREEKARRNQAQAVQPTVSEQFQKARVHLDQWLDFDRNRRPIMAGDMEYIRKDPDIQRFMHYHARFGQEMLHKLWSHLQFMVENRRKYYCAIG